MNRYRLVTISGVLAVGLVIGLGISRLQERPTGPEEVILDKEVCRYCGMHVGDIRYVGQIQTESQTLFYDDPGCLIHDWEKIQEPIVAVYFRHYLEDRWIPKEKALFVRVGESPMGHGLGAIDRDDPENSYQGYETFSLEQARVQVLMKSGHGGAQ